MSNRNQVLKQVKELRKSMTKYEHLVEVVTITHLLTMYQYDNPKIGQIVFGFLDDQLKVNELLEN